MFISVNDRSKAEIGAIAKMFEELGFKVMATGGTADTIKAAGVQVEKVRHPPAIEPSSPVFFTSSL